MLRATADWDIKANHGVQVSSRLEQNMVHLHTVLGAFLPINVVGQTYVQAAYLPESSTVKSPPGGEWVWGQSRQVHISTICILSPFKVWMLNHFYMCVGKRKLKGEERTS